MKPWNAGLVDAAAPRIRTGDLRALLAAPSGASPRARRDRARVALLSLGCRPCEVARARAADLNGRTLLVRRAKGRSRQIPLDLLGWGAAVRAALDEHIAARGDVRPDQPLVASETGGALTPAAVRRIVRKLGRKAGLASRVAPYSCRKAVVRAATDRGLPITIVARAAGTTPVLGAFRSDRPGVTEC
jgi:site-specific recombinase XerD